MSEPKVLEPNLDLPGEGQKAPDLNKDITPQDQRLAFAADVDAKDKGKAPVPPMEIAGAGDKGVKDQPANPEQKALTGKDLEVSRRLQEMLLRYVYMLPTVQKKENESMEEAGKRADKELEERKAAILEEREKGIFGPASQKAYQQFVEKLQQVIPQTVSDIASMNLPIPPGCPMELTRDKYNFLLSPELYRKKVASGEITCDLGIDASKAPTFEALSKIESTLRFQAQSVAWRKEASDRLLDDGLQYLIKSNGLPEKWAQLDGMEPETWRQAAHRTTTLALTVRNYIEAGYQIQKANRYGENFKFELPPGVKIKEKDGKIVSIDLDLPEDLRLGHPRNQLKMERLQQWLEENGKKIDDALEQAGKSGLHAWGDDAIASHNKIVFDKDGNLVGIFKNDYKVNEEKGERALDANLLEYRYDVKKLDNGQIEVTQRLQVQNVPWWSYQDLLYWENVGNAVVTKHTYNADDFVRIRDGGKIQLCKAKDLEYFKNVQAGWHYGTKVVMGVLDAAMLVSGTIQFGAGLKAASLGVRAASAAGATAARATAWEGVVQAGRGLFRAGVGGLGIINNAWGHSDDLGMALNRGRTYFFMYDIARGLIPEAAKSLVRPSFLTEVGRVGQKFEELAKTSKFYWLHKIPESGFKWSERGMVPIIGRDFMHVVIEGAPKPHLSYADQLKGDRSVVKLPEKGLFDLGKKENFQATERLLDNYSTTLQEGRSQDTQQKIKDIFEQTKKLMGPDAKPEDREKFKQELTKKLMFDPVSIQVLEKMKDRRLTDDEFKKLLNPETRRILGRDVEAGANAADKQANRDIQAAAATALIFLGTDKDGKLSETVAETSIHVDKQEWTEYVSTGGEGGTAAIPHKIEAHDIQVKFTAEDLVKFMRRDLEAPAKELGNRGIITGDILMRVGALSGIEYANVLQDVLRNPEASRADKMRALSDKSGPRYAEVLDSLTQFEQAASKLSPEQAAKANALLNGVTSEEFKSTLRDLARNEKDPDVRAMAAAMIHGLTERERVNSLTIDLEHLKANNPAMTEERWNETRKLFQNEDMQASFLKTSHQSWEDSIGKEAGSFKDKTTAALKAAMEMAIPENCPPEKAYLLRERKISAALALSLMPSDEATTRAVNKAIAESVLQTPDLEKLTSDPLHKHLHHRYLDLAVRVANHFYPENVGKVDAKTQEDVRKKLLSLIRTPQDFTEETKQVELLKALTLGMKDAPAEEKKVLIEKCQKMIDPAAGKDFAGGFGQSRAQAISTIASFGHRDSIDLIRARSTAMLSMELANKKIVKPCGEEDARVRLAAVTALEKLTDERLGEIAALLVNNEKDPMVSIRLRAIATRYENPSEDQQSRYRKAYDAKYQETVAKLTRDARTSVVDGMTNQQVYDWLKSKDGTRLLNRDNWYADRTRRAQDIYNNWGTIDWVFSRRKTIVDGMSKGAEESDGERDALWGKFVRLARGQSVDGLSAGSLMPDIAVGTIRDRLTKDVKDEIDSLTKQKDAVEKKEKELTDQIAANQKAIDAATAKFRTENEKLTRDIDTARGTVETTRGKLGQAKDDTAKQLAQLQLEVAEKNLTQLTTQFSDKQKKLTEENSAKQQETEKAQRELLLLKSQKDQIEKDLRRANALHTQVSRGLDLNNPTTQLEVASGLAKRQLYLIIADGASGVEGTPDQNNPEYGEYKLPVYSGTTSTLQWKEKAATALAECCKPGTVGRAQAVEYVKQLLVTKEVPASCRMTLLNAFKEVAKPDKDGKALRDQLSLNEDELAIVTLKALEVEIGRPEGDQSKDYQLALIKDLKTYGYRPAFAVLDGMMEKNQFSKVTKEVRDEAGKTLNYLRDGLLPIWHRTISDTSADAATRAKRVADQAELYKVYQRSPFADKEIAADQMIQSLFNNYKNYKFKSADDPGIKILRELMASDHQKVKQAAAQMALEASLDLPPETPIMNEAVKCLADLAIRGKQPQYRWDAFNELAWMAGKNKGNWNKNGELSIEVMDGSEKKTITLRKSGKDGKELTIFERTNGEITSMVYPTGTSCQFLRENGALSTVVENGIPYYRKKDAAGKFTNEWLINGDPNKKWIGTAELTAEGVYTQQQTGKNPYVLKPGG